jgi:hypothetical protein
LDRVGIQGDRGDERHAGGKLEAIGRGRAKRALGGLFAAAAEAQATFDLAAAAFEIHGQRALTRTGERVVAEARGDETAERGFVGARDGRLRAEIAERDARVLGSSERGAGRDENGDDERGSRRASRHSREHYLEALGVT